MSIKQWFHRLRSSSKFVSTPMLLEPVVTEDMRLNGLVWARTTADEWIEICDFCGGNCGQCGLTSRLGNVPASIERMAKNMQEP